MFKKPLKDTKTSAPLRASDRRKLRDRIVAKFCPNNPDDGNVLVPDGLQSMKIATHSGEPGVVYSSHDGDPLWFSLGKGAEELIPTVYTLWKRPTILPFISTPSAVIPVLLNGADLMAAGIVETSDSLPNAGDIVYVASWARDSRGPALAVGTMLLDSEKIISENVSKGKAVAIIHTWKDHLWAMGSQSAPPETVPASPAPEDSGAGGAQSQEERDSASNPSPDTPNGSFQQAEAAESSDGPSHAALTAEEISNILREALLQAIQTTISSLPPSAFPIPASTFYTTYILPARPLHVASASPPVDIKHSSFKALKSFLKHAEKQGLLRLKDARGDTLIASVNLQHEDVAHRAMHRTVGDLEGNMKKQKEKEEQREQEEQAREKQISVIELWKPHTTTVKLFEEAKLDTSALYTLPELKSALNGYISTHELINKGEQQFINVDADPILRDALWPQSGKKPPPVPEFAKREEVLSTLCARMQTWHRIQIGTGDPIVKKGQLEPVSVVVKIRQGRKACTLVTGHEPFLLSSATIAEALRSRCASATSVAPLPGRAAGEEVMIQGKQTKIVMDYLKAMGVPKKWIKAEDTTDKKKK